MMTDLKRWPLKQLSLYSMRIFPSRFRQKMKKHERMLNYSLLIVFPSLNEKRNVVSEWLPVWPIGTSFFIA